MQRQQEMPDYPGEWWFTGMMTMPHSPMAATTVHLETPTRFLVVQTQFGLIPCDPIAYYPYALCIWAGWWESRPRPRQLGRIPNELTQWMETEL